MYCAVSFFTYNVHIVLYHVVVQVVLVLLFSSMAILLSMICGHWHFTISAWDRRGRKGGEGTIMNESFHETGHEHMQFGPTAMYYIHPYVVWPHTVLSVL